MLIARAPLRLSLAGGGTDIEAYYRRYGGTVVSTTIDKYFYVIVSLSDSPRIQVSSSDYHTFYRHPVDEASIWDGDLRLPKAIIDRFDLRAGFSVFLASQAPPGTGLGSSSTVAVALIKALSVLCRTAMTPAEIAELACHIEIDKLGQPIGRQDQYAAAFGGLNHIEFTDSGVAVTPLDLPGETAAELEQRLMLFFTGRSHSSGSILAEQTRNSERPSSRTVDHLHAIKDCAEELLAGLKRGCVDGVGDCLHRSWMAKRELAAGISDPWIDRCYETARRSGAAGGKLTGAGGGGFLLLYCEPEHQSRVAVAMESLALSQMDFRFESGGAMVLVNTMYELAASAARV